MRISCLPLGLAMLVLACANSHAPTDAASRSDAAELRDAAPPRVDAGGSTGDRDGDTILDEHERHRDGDVDTDGDGIPDWHDLDSDDDGTSDIEEAGDPDPSTPPVDTDEDFIPDFRDPDSDDDGLSDAQELELGTSRTRTDTDGDGVSDLIEHYADTDPLDSSESPRHGDVSAFVIDCPSAPSPVEEIVRFVLEADVLPAPADLRLSFEAIDAEAARFFDSLEAAPDAPDCTSSLEPFDADGDGLSEGLRNVSAGETACWRVRPHSVGPTECMSETLLLRGRLVVHRGDEELDERRVLFVLVGDYPGPPAE